MKKLICLILCSVIVFSLVGCSKAKADAGYRRGTYNGTLKSLVKSDYQLLKEFINTGEFADVQGIITVNCNDYRLTRGVGESGMADVTDGTFYEDGLVEYSEETSNGYYDRFRKDYVVEIYKLKGGYEVYWFTSYSDALSWLQDRYN